MDNLLVFEKFAAIPDTIWLKSKAEDPARELPPDVDLFKIQITSGIDSKIGKKDPKTTIQRYFQCRPCGAEVYSIKTLRDHVNGIPHGRKIGEIQSESYEPPDKRVKTSPGGDSGSALEPRDIGAVHLELGGPVVGSEYLTEFAFNGVNYLYECSLCNGFTADSLVMFQHLGINGHQMKYFRRKYPEVEKKYKKLNKRNLNKEVAIEYHNFEFPEVGRKCVIEDESEWSVKMRNASTCVFTNLSSVHGFESYKELVNRRNRLKKSIFSGQGHVKPDWSEFKPDLSIVEAEEAEASVQGPNPDHIADSKDIQGIAMANVNPDPALDVKPELKFSINEVDLNRVERGDVKPDVKPAISRHLDKRNNPLKERIINLVKESLMVSFRCKHPKVTTKEQFRFLAKEISDEILRETLTKASETDLVNDANLKHQISDRIQHRLDSKDDVAD